MHNNTITYNNYALLIYFFKNFYESSLLGKKQNNEEINKNLTAICNKYKNDIHANQEKIQNRNEIVKLDNYILNPSCYTLLGPLDDLSLVLIDDFAPMITITNKLQSSINHTDIAFCPKVKDDQDGCFYNLDRILIDKENIPDWKNKHPLLVYSCFKMNYINLYTGGLVNQAAVYKSIINKINELIKSLNEANIPVLIQKCDFKNLACVLLDNQGSHEISVLIFCSNYTLATSLVAAISTITLKDIIKLTPELQSQIMENNCYQTLKEYYTAPKYPQITDFQHWFQNSYFFYSTYSTLGISYESFIDQDNAEFNGLIEIYTQLDICAGFRSKIENIIRENIKREANNCIIPNTIHRYMIGKHDYIFNYTGKEHCEPIALKDFLKIFFDLYSNLFTHTNGEISRCDLLDISSIIVIPLPKIEVNNIDLIFNEEEACILPPGEILSNLQKALFRSVMVSEEKLPKSSSAPETLDDIIRCLRIPYSLRRTISFLFRSFQRACIDPFLFDSVIDLYHIFEILYKLLSIDLRDEQKNQDTEYNRRNYFNYNKYIKLASFVEALQNALNYRTYRPLPEKSFWDNNTDFKGVISQPIAASNVPALCGNEALKIILNKNNYAATITMISFNPYPRSTRLNIIEQISDESAFLSKMEINISSLFDPTSYLEYFTQAIFMVFEFLVYNEKLGEPIKKLFFKEIEQEKQKKKTILLGGPLQDRVRNVLSAKFIYALIFRDTEHNQAGKKLFIKYYLINHATKVTSIGNDLVESVQQFTEILIRLLLILFSEKLVKLKNNNPNQDKVLITYFMDFFYENKEFFSEYCFLTDSYKKIIEEFLEKQFMEIFNRTIEYINIDKESEFNRYISDIIDNSSSFEKEYIANGIPLSIEDYIKQNINSESEGKETGNMNIKHIITFFGKIMRQYLHLEYDTITETSCLFIRRDLKTGEIESPYNKIDLKNQNMESINNFYIDNGYPVLFCADSVERRKRILRQITTIKSLWEISNNFKAEIFNKLIKKL